MTKGRIAAAVGVCAVFAGSALAGDVAPPNPANPLAPWTRGDAGTTFNLWTFSSPATGPTQTSSNPALGPGNLSNTGSSSWVVETPDGRGSGLWEIPSGSFLVFTIPNFGDPHAKIVYSQLRYYGAQPEVVVRDPDQGTFATTWAPVNPGPTAIGGGLSTWGVSLSFPYCPEVEQIRIINSSASPIYLEQLVIDTHCTPAPGAAALLALGGVLAGRRRR